jgi:hypothetical protein
MTESPYQEKLTATNTQILDLAARQRMLNQRILKEAAARAFGAKINLEFTRRTLRSTAESLTSGGDVPLTVSANPEVVSLPEPPSVEIKQSVQRQFGCLVNLEQSIDIVLRTEASSSGFLPAFQSTLQEGDSFHAAADDTTKAYSRYFQEQQNDLANRERSVSEQLRTLMEEARSPFAICWRRPLKKFPRLASN